MRLATLRTPYGTTTIRVEGENIGIELDHEDVGALLRTEDWRKAAALSGEPVAFAPEDLAPVIPHPGKIICVGLNYAKHIREMGREFPGVPTLFIKFPDALTGPYDNVHIPPFGQSKLDYEGELAVVIGRRAHHVTAAEALDYVAGYSIINDYTLRDFQRATTQFHAGKSFYRTAGFGPWLTTSDEWAPGGDARLTTTVDGEVRQDDNTDELIFSVARLIEFCSQLYPLHPGDVIATGTPEGVGFAREPQAFIQDGQTVRIEIEGLGHIANQTIYDHSVMPSIVGEDLLGHGHNHAQGASESCGCGGNCSCGGH